MSANKLEDDAKLVFRAFMRKQELNDLEKTLADEMVRQDAEKQDLNEKIKQVEGDVRLGKYLLELTERI